MLYAIRFNLKDNITPLPAEINVCIEVVAYNFPNKVDVQVTAADRFEVDQCILASEPLTRFHYPTDLYLEYRMANSTHHDDEI
jgi:hypothetical protein